MKLLKLMIIFALMPMILFGGNINHSDVIFKEKRKNKVIYSYDFGKTWQEVQFAGIDKNNFKGIEQLNDNVIVYTNDAGKSWQKVQFAEIDKDNFKGIEQLNNKVIVYTDDAGKSWQEVQFAGIDKDNFKGIEQLNNNVIVYTDDAGKTWYKLNVETTENNGFDISLHPQPADDIVNLRISNVPDSDLNHSIAYKIIDIKGNTVLSGKLNYSPEVMIRLDNLVSGLYILELNLLNTTKHVKFMKN